MVGSASSRQGAAALLTRSHGGAVPPSVARPSRRDSRSAPPLRGVGHSPRCAMCDQRRGDGAGPRQRLSRFAGLRTSHPADANTLFSFGLPADASAALAGQLAAGLEMAIWILSRLRSLVLGPAVMRPGGLETQHWRSEANTLSGAPDPGRAFPSEHGRDTNGRWRFRPSPTGFLISRGQAPLAPLSPGLCAAREGRRSNLRCAWS